MIDIPVVTKLIEGAVKIAGGVRKLRQHSEEQKEDEMMRTITDDMRRRKADCIRPQIGSEQDRFCQKMVVKRYLKRSSIGYMLPEVYRGF